MDYVAAALETIDSSSYRLRSPDFGDPGFVCAIIDQLVNE